mmetsp:Transcript_26394/g.71363  ORF Transcript_26394/g.71363 Transcript_26394/m.71363 type:complete len:525 (-) Transcript_26394:117-1691(-)
MEELILNLQQHHVIALSETRTSDMNRILQFMPHHVLVGNTYIPSTSNGRKGQGVALIVSKAIADYFTILNISETTQTVYARCDSLFLGKEQPVVFAVTYIAPERSEDRHNIASQYLHLGQELQHYLLYYSPHLVLCGDFNAHIGSSDEITDAHFDILNACPILFSKRKAQCLHVNRAGQYLIRLASTLGLTLTTGRVPGDKGQPTFVGYNKTCNSRPDHILTSRSMFLHIKWTNITVPKLLDHCYLSVSLSMTSNIPGVDMRLHRNPLYGPHPNFLKWKPERSNDFVNFLEQDTLAQQRFYHAIESQNIECTWSELKNWILRAAVQSGMTTAGIQNWSPPNNTPKKAEWFDSFCFHKKQAYLNAAFYGADSYTKTQLFHEYRSYAQHCKRRYLNTKRRIFLHKLFDNDPTVHRMLKKPAEKHVTPVSEDAWSSHLHAVFRRTPSCCDEEGVEKGEAVEQPQQATAIESRESFVHLGANEQRHNCLQQESSSLLGIPTETELFNLVSKHISSMPTRHSPHLLTRL